MPLDNLVIGVGLFGLRLLILIGGLLRQGVVGRVWLVLRKRLGKWILRSRVVLCGLWGGLLLRLCLRVLWLGLLRLRFFFNNFLFKLLFGSLK